MMKIFLLTAVIILMMGCTDEGSASCDSQISSLTNELGAPEEVDRYDSGDYHSHSYWYWSIGFSRTFTWGDFVDGCEVSDYTFSPIG